MIIQNFKNEILENMGFSPESFDKDYLQWTYKFNKNNLSLEFTYSMDRTISTFIYLNDILIASNFATNLENIFIHDNIINVILVNGSLTRKLSIDPFNISVNWIDEFI